MCSDFSNRQYGVVVARFLAVNKLLYLNFNHSVYDINHISLFCYESDSLTLYFCTAQTTKTWQRGCAFRYDVICIWKQISHVITLLVRILTSSKLWPHLACSFFPLQAPFFHPLARVNNKANLKSPDATQSLLMCCILLEHGPLLPSILGVYSCDCYPMAWYSLLVIGLFLEMPFNILSVAFHASFTAVSTGVTHVSPLKLWIFGHAMLTQYSFE